jgi:hypothetical protein
LTGYSPILLLPSLFLAEVELDEKSANGSPKPDRRAALAAVLAVLTRDAGIDRAVVAAVRSAERARGYMNMYE